jgi:hypothetical protein
VSDLVATLVTHRPAVFQTQIWAERDGAPFRARVIAPADVLETDWHDAELLVADVATVELLDVVFGRRAGVTLLIGYGPQDDEACARLYAAGRCGGFSRMDRFDSRSSLLAILDAFRAGAGREQLLEVLSRE